MKQHFNKTDWEFLQETALVGAQKSTLSLSKLLKKPVHVQVTQTKILNIEEILSLLGGRESLVAVVYFDVHGSFSADALFVFPMKVALQLADFLLGRKTGTTKILDEFAQSALKELGNISSASYLTALSEVLEGRLIHSVPSLAVDMLQAVLDGILVSKAEKIGDIIMLDTLFEIEKIKIPGHFLFLPDPEGIEKIFRVTLRGGDNDA